MRMNVRRLLKAVAFQKGSDGLYTHWQYKIAGLLHPCEPVLLTNIKVLKFL